MRRCTKTLIGLGLIGIGLSTGCATMGRVFYPHRNLETLAMSPDEHRSQVDSIIRADRRGLANDLDLLFMTDRPTRLSRWHDR